MIRSVVFGMRLVQFMLTHLKTTWVCTRFCACYPRRCRKLQLYPCQRLPLTRFLSSLRSFLNVCFTIFISTQYRYLVIFLTALYIFTEINTFRFQLPSRIYFEMIRDLRPGFLQRILREIKDVDDR